MFWILLLLAASVYADQPCTDKTSVEVTNGTFLHDGTVLMDGVTYTKKNLYTKNDNGTVRTYGCLCKLRDCFSKCCPLGSVLYNKVCTEMPNSDMILQYGFNVSFLSTFKYNVGVESGSFSLIYGRPCDQVYIEDTPWYLQKNTRNGNR
ncbi:hypothetical protein K1T71_007645 [Dendrolimus kikuchii]|uniref:Uncharacterized protein n=1 Tax=Dendrolimus kikuchii TaxID=765133 RepID=A0ACC1CY13_9NEOP|nr:hypothetical protein K1T71_007645 [Dendrolimus kikuchii]